MMGRTQAIARCAAVAVLVAAAAVSTSAASAQQAERPTPRHSRTEAPEPHRPAGPLHFLGLTSFDEGKFADPGSILRAGGRAEVWLLTVGGQLRHVAEGDIRWTWARIDIDCAGRAWETLEYDAYDTEGAWLAGFAGALLETNPVDYPAEEVILAYACDGTRPADFQIVQDQASAVTGIIQAFDGQ